MAQWLVPQPLGTGDQVDWRFESPLRWVELVQLKSIWTIIVYWVVIRSISEFYPKVTSWNLWNYFRKLTWYPNPRVFNWSYIIFNFLGAAKGIFTDSGFLFCIAFCTSQSYSLCLRKLIDTFLLKFRRVIWEWDCWLEVLLPHKENVTPFLI